MRKAAITCAITATLGLAQVADARIRHKQVNADAVVAWGAHQVEEFDCWISHVPDEPGLDGARLHCTVQVWDCGKLEPFLVDGGIACFPSAQPNGKHHKKLAERIRDSVQVHGPAISQRRVRCDDPCCGRDRHRYELARRLDVARQS